MASHRRPSSPGLTQSARVTAVSATVVVTAAGLGGGMAGADPGERREDARATVDRLFAEAEQATERYNEAGERVRSLRGRVTRAQDAVARGQERLNRMRGALGALAGAQYRSGGVDPALDLLLSADPDSYLTRAELLERVSQRQGAALDQLRHAQRQLGQQRAEALRDLGELERSRAVVARHKRAVTAKLASARRVLNALPPAERAAFGAGSGMTGLPEELTGPAASGRAAAAAAAARRALGLPYVWGANGPRGFDCSGLTQWAYAQAGVSIPRTSQAQRYAGRQVSLAEARPGDLVTYRSDASHVAMYMGGGQVIHAPYPGASVRYDPVGMMPIASVTRV
ncbi:NlpC/P60 family protein [Streptomyces sp. NPDC057638]|uniref:C40 family peptidase n=1 Tax=Streptomyces sp. NPDC057638 TaxID=3346190 RepID=UPI003686ADFA